MKFKILLLFDGEDYFFSEGLLPSLLGLSFVFTLILSMSVLGNTAHYGIMGYERNGKYFSLRS